MTNNVDPLWESLVSEAWFRGNLSYKLHATQKKIDKAFKDSPGQLFVGNCSRQLGKTFWAVSKALEIAIKIPNAQIRYGAAFHSDLVTFIIPAFNKALEDCPETLRPTYKTSGTQFIFPNGSRIRLVGLDRNPDGLRGNTLDLIILDECGFVDTLDYLYKSIIIPATMHRPKARIIMISTPPSTPAHPFVDYCQRAEYEGSYAKFTIYDNPMIKQDTIDRLMKEAGGKDSTTWRREYECEFVTDSDSAIIPEWKDDFIQEIEHDEFHVYYHKYVAMDLGVNDFTAAIFGYYDFKKATLIIEDEITMNGPQMNTELLVKALKNKELDMWGEDMKPFRRISDNNNPLLIADLNTMHNMPFIFADKDNKEAAINELRLLIQSGNLIVHPRCKQLIGCLKYGVWDKNRKQFARSTVYGHFDHLDALIYLVRMMARSSNPIPATHKATHRTWLGGINTQSKNAQVLKDVFKPKHNK